MAKLKGTAPRPFEHNPFYHHARRQHTTPLPRVKFRIAPRPGRSPGRRRLQHDKPVWLPNPRLVSSLACSHVRSRWLYPETIPEAAVTPQARVLPWTREPVSLSFVCALTNSRRVPPPIRCHSSSDTFANPTLRPRVARRPGLDSAHSTRFVPQRLRVQPGVTQEARFNSVPGDFDDLVHEAIAPPLPASQPCPRAAHASIR